MRNILNQVLKLVVAGGLLFWLIQSGRLDFKSLVSLLTLQYLFLCLLCTGLSLGIASQRWHILLKAQNIVMPYKEILKLTLIGNFFNFAMPGGVGGDLVRGFYLARHNADAKAGSVISVVMDRLTGLYSMVIMAIFAMLIFFKQSIERYELKLAFVFLIFLFLGFTIFWICLLSEKVFQKLPQKDSFFKIYSRFANYRNHKPIFYRSLILSFVSQIFSILFFVTAGHGLGYPEIPVYVYFFVVPLGFMLTAIPISIAGIGVGQAAFLYLFNLALNAKSQIGPATITAYQVSLFAYGLLGAYFYLRIKKQISK